MGGQGQTRVTPETQSARAVWTRFVLWKVENGGKKGRIRGHRSPCPDGGVGHGAGWSLGLGHRADQGTGRRAREILSDKFADVWGLSQDWGSQRPEKAMS